MAHFTSLDYILMVVLLVSVVVSFFRGFLKEAISLITWFVAFVAALKFAPLLSDHMQNHIANGTIRYILSAVSIFIVVMIVGMLINKLAHALVTTSGLGVVDHLLGFIFGVLRGILFCSILLLILQASPVQSSDWVAHSILAPYFQPMLGHFSKWIPSDVRTVSTWMNQFGPLKHVST